MTWIKPSFFWMMYRAGWATKPNQEHILAIKIKRAGIDWALQNACLSHFDSDLHESHEKWKEQLQNAPVRVQWDPERNIHLEKLDYRSIQIGLSGEAVDQYINEWIVAITDITAECRRIKALITEDLDGAIRLVPKEEVYG
ncbi:MAG: DUF4291 domain-containing protein [Bacteroidota bacterium]